MDKLSINKANIEENLDTNRVDIEKNLGISGSDKLGISRLNRKKVKGQLAIR